MNLKYKKTPDEGFKINSIFDQKRTPFKEIFLATFDKFKWPLNRRRRARLNQQKMLI